MNWIESLLYGLISGFTEFLPVSSAAHQILMEKLFGTEGNSSLRSLLVHFSLLAVLCYSCSSLLQEMNNRPAATRSGRRVVRRPPEVRLIRTAAIPLLLGFALYPLVNSWVHNLILPTVFFVVNGMILFAPSRLASGNKDARGMSGFDSILIGLSGVLAVCPGISRVGSMTSVAIVRGAEKQQALNWSLLLSVPALVALIAFDVFAVISGGGLGSVAGILGYILSAAGAAIGGYFGIMLMRFLAVKTGFSGFAYYSWGAALFSFILYLIVL